MRGKGLGENRLSALFSRDSVPSGDRAKRGGRLLRGPRHQARSGLRRGGRSLSESALREAAPIRVERARPRRSSSKIIRGRSPRGRRLRERWHRARPQAGSSSERGRGPGRDSLEGCRLEGDRRVRGRPGFKRARLEGECISGDVPSCFEPFRASPIENALVIKGQVSQNVLWANFTKHLISFKRSRQT